MKNENRNKFGKIIKYEGTLYRYNEQEALLEWVSFNDYSLESDEWIEFDEPKVVDCIGLSKENAESYLMSYIEQWHYENKQELNTI